MPEWIKWLFDGIGTELLSLIIGLLFGGFTGYKIGIRNKSKQTQKAGDNAHQTQSFNIEVQGSGKDTGKQVTKVVQTQEAGKNANQTQVGDFYDG